MPVGYGTTVYTNEIYAKFFNTSNNLGVIGEKLISNKTTATRLTSSDTDQSIYRYPLSTWSGEVPAGTDQFSIVPKDTTSTPYITFNSVGWSGTNGNFKGTITAYLCYGPSHNNYTSKIYPVSATLYFWYDGSSRWDKVGSYTPANGKITINVDVTQPVEKIGLSFIFDKGAKYSNNFPSPNVCWGLTYIDEMKWSKSGITTGQQTVDEIQESNNLLTGLLSGINSIFNSIIELPQKLGELFVSLFIPNEENINILRGKWQVFLTSKMGFIYQMFQWVDTFFEGIIDGLSGEDDGAFTIPAFPAFEAGGETVQLWSEPLTVDFSDNAFVQTLQPIACPFILGVTAYHLWFSMSDLMECFFAGKSYRDFSHRRDDG